MLDVDGTLGPGALGVDLLRELTTRGMCEREAADQVLATLSAFSEGSIDFSTMAERAYAAYARALAGRECVAIEAAAQEVWSHRRTQLFDFVPDLLGCLRERGYALMLISGSPIEMVARVARSLEIPEAYGAVFTRADGRYTGGVDLSAGMPGQKAHILATVTADRPLALEQCFAIGDSVTDIALFERLGRSIAFEPSAALEAIARARGWTIATRDDVVAQTQALLAIS